MKYEIKNYYGRYCIILNGWNVKSFATKKRAEAYIAEMTQDKTERSVPVKQFGRIIEYITL